MAAGQDAGRTTLEGYAKALRRKWYVLITVFLGILAGTIVVTILLPPIYSATATIWLTRAQREQDAYVAQQVDQLIVNTYGELISSPNVAAAVARNMGSGWTSDVVKRHTSFQVVQRTNLILIKATDRDPAGAARLANTYGEVFASSVGDRGLFGTRVELADPAVVPTNPVRPRPILYGGLGVIIGLLLSTSGAILADRLDRRIRLDEEAEELLALPVLGRIPRGVGNGALSPLEREAFRMLAASLRFRLSSVPAVIMITSSDPDEGKSTILQWLAAALAELRLQVVLIDADLRRPSLHTILGVSRNPGLADHIVADVPLEGVLQSTGLNGVRVITAGSPVANPVLLLESPRFAEVLQSGRQSWDVTLVDTPPVMMAADAAIVGPKTDGVLFTVRMSHTGIAEARRSLDQLTKVGARMLGLVLNRTQLLPGRYGYYYGDGDKKGL